MKNIFENAYFGKAYKTKDGRKAIFFTKATCDGVTLLTDKYGLDHYHNDGTIFHCTNENDNIVSEWKEEINEKELEQVAEKFAHKHAIYPDVRDRKIIAKEYFKAGFRKALEE